MFKRCAAVSSACVLVFLLAGCGAPRPDDAPVIPAPVGAVEPTCVPVKADNLMVGNWYVVRKQAGVAGEIQSLLTLDADGRMRQTTRVKQGRNIRSELRESGCWQVDQGKLVTRVSRSNGELIDFNDPIYRASYVVDKVDSTRLQYREDKPGSKAVIAKRMPAGFKLN